MQIAKIGDLDVHYREDGDPSGTPLVFSNSLGTDLRLWDKLMPHLPAGYRILRYDKRGHGLTTCPEAPYKMGQLVKDAAGLMDHLGYANAIFVGLSIGGLIAQGLATARPDLTRAIVLSNTATKIGTRAMWDERIEAAQSGGIEVMADAIMERWFSAEFRATPEVQGWRNLLTRQPNAGYAGCSAAISGTDFMETTSVLSLPALAIAGSEDGSTPPDLVRETANLIQGSRFELIRGAGHLPCIEKPEEFARILNAFLAEVCDD